MKTEQSAPLWIYDTTLRDGAQREGISLSVDDKLTIAHQLDKLGIAFIEGGWPGANPKDKQFFQKLQASPLRQAEIVAFCSTRRPHTAVEEDPILQPILESGTRWVTVFGKSWDLHVKTGLKTTLDENLAMIADSVEYLRQQGRRIIYDAEHWFDGYQRNPTYALETVQAAIDAGAEWIVLCDTNGGSLPHEIAESMQAVLQLIADHPTRSARIGIHTHNDSGTAVANALTAVQWGAEMVQGTINGYGERCGNANLCTLIPNLQLKLGYHCVKSEQLTELTSSSRLISELVNLAPDEHAPFVGLSAFAHKGGIHVSAVQRDPQTYEHIDPDTVGNLRRIVISEQSGLSNVLEKAHHCGVALDKQNPVSRQLLQQLKQLEHDGYQFEAAEASFELLLRQALDQRPSLFELHGFDVHCYCGSLEARQQGGFSSTALATVKVVVGVQEILTAAEGNGPVSALDAALRKALVDVYPSIAKFQLTDYKVRILDGKRGTSAKTRVLVESTDGQNRWTTVGVSTNIIGASYQAVAEGIEYGLLRPCFKDSDECPIGIRAILNGQHF
ncbi:citramalate synthase [Acaryochloris sp. IP29b_bin.137]|uniref:citramalate synthase n=1 Tax=Acaryochloris sp. IP29b_bin.137 TaxID=2969217 RepID=UPI00262EB134|nr:citramalate synthase [Acaryochloris sp. IP29b_bin.137]